MRWKPGGLGLLASAPDDYSIMYSDPPGYVINKTIHGDTQTYMGVREAGKASEIVHVIRVVPVDDEEKKQAAVREMKAACERHREALPTGDNSRRQG